MAEYIKRDDLLELYDLNGLEVENAKVPLAVVIQNIKDIPSADVVERKKGKWIEQEDGWGGYYYDCSVCNESWTTIDGTPWDNGMNFCPNCGADMRCPQIDDN